MLNIVEFIELAVPVGWLAGLNHTRTFFFFSFSFAYVFLLSSSILDKCAYCGLVKDSLVSHVKDLNFMLQLRSDKSIYWSQFGSSRWQVYWRQILWSLPMTSKTSKGLQFFYDSKVASKPWQLSTGVGFFYLYLSFYFFFYFYICSFFLRWFCSTLWRFSFFIFL